jgi:hypothetical protein
MSFCKQTRLISLFVLTAFALGQKSFGEGERPSSIIPQVAAQMPEGDSAHEPGVSKSWTREGPTPEWWNEKFLNSLDWTDHQVGHYVLRTGVIYDKWVAAMQFVKDGQVLLTEYTPPGEYITVVDPIEGKPVKGVFAIDANEDDVMEIAFEHEKLNDPRYHLFTVYALEKDAPRLLWKSAGRLGDWVHHADGKPAGIRLEFQAAAVE